MYQCWRGARLRVCHARDVAHLELERAQEATTSTAMGDLLGLYRNLPSPPGSFADSTRELDELSPAQVDLLWHAFADSAPQGITTPLFAYQRVSL